LEQQNLAIFASGNGTNAEEIFKYFNDHSSISVNGLLTNNSNAHVLIRAASNHIPCHIFNREEFANGDEILNTLRNWDINVLILAGFLWLIPEYLIDQYQDRILNIHPALLPQFGGKGMYGMHVHQAVLDSGQKESGITIHLVNNQYDRGRILFQKRCSINPQDTPDTLAVKIHDLEHRYYPQVIEQWLSKE